MEAVRRTLVLQEFCLDSVDKVVEHALPGFGIACWCDESLIPFFLYIEKVCWRVVFLS